MIPVLGTANSAVKLATAEFIADPYPTYAWLREHAPIYYSDEWQGYVLTRYRDVLAGFRDPRLSAQRVAAFSSQLPPMVRERLAPLLGNLSHWALFTDPPVHTRLRGLLNRAFAPKLIESMRPRLQTLVQELVDELLRNGSHQGTENGKRSIDVIADLAVPLPVLAIGEILGLPREGRQSLKLWSDALASFFGGRQPTPAVLEQARTAILELEAYFRILIAERRHRPQKESDLLAALCSAEESGTILNEEELLSTCAMVLFGGHETTTNLIGNAIWLLTQHKEIQTALRQNHDAIPAFIEEALRFETPIQRMGRVAAEDIVLHGQAIRQGQRVWLVMGAANRDPEQFSEPDVLNTERADNRHLAFGFGSHYCIGAVLGRMEAQLAIAGLLSALPRIETSGESPERLDNLTIRGYKQLGLRHPDAP